MMPGYTVDGSEINENHHLGCIKIPVNNGISWIPINWLARFLPSTVVCYLIISTDVFLLIDGFDKKKDYLASFHDSLP